MAEKKSFKKGVVYDANTFTPEDFEAIGKVEGASYSYDVKKVTDGKEEAKAPEVPAKP